MSLFQTDHGIRAISMWPTTLMPVTDTEELEEWQLVPTSFEGVCSWACIASNQNVTDYSRTHLLLYRNPGALSVPGAYYPVTVRIQGFINQLNISPLGSWNGSSETAIRASQYLTLSSGGYDAAWYATLSGIRNLRQLVHNSLTRQGRRFEEPLPAIDDDIYLTRRVFTKVGTETPDSVLDPRDDIEGNTWRIAHEWRVTEKIIFGRRREDGTAVATSHLVFSKGDFVEVDVGFDVSWRAHRGLAVQLNMKQVVQVMTAERISLMNLNREEKSVSGEIVAGGAPVNHNVIYRPGLYVHHE